MGIGVVCFASTLHWQDNRMPNHSSRDNRHDYLVRARAPETLATALHYVTNHPAFALLRMVGPVAEPHTLLIATSEAGAAMLQKHFGDELIIERDRPLQMF